MEFFVRKKVLNAISYFSGPKFLSEPLGLSSVFEAVKNGSCDEFKCRRDKEEEEEMKNFLVEDSLGHREMRN